MITERIQWRNVDRGELIILNGDIENVYRVIINSDDDVILEQLTPVYRFIVWNIAQDKFKYVDKIKSST